MKGLIAEINERHMIIMTKNGDFIKCKKLPNCNIGDEVNIPKASITTIYKKMSVIAASFIMFAMLFTGVYAYYTPYSYVSVDINPSLELSVNRFEKVIGVHAFNQDAEKLLAEAEGLKNKEVDEALEVILNGASEKGYLKANAQNSVMIVVSSNNKKEEGLISNRISKTSTEVLSHINKDYEVILEKAKPEVYKKAKSENISPGKVILANKFKQAKPEINEEEIKKMPLQQVIKEIEKEEPKNPKQDKPKETKKPVESQDKVKTVKEFIKEKNKELGEKLDQPKEKVNDKKDNGIKPVEKENKEDKDKKNDKNTVEDTNSFNNTGDSIEKQQDDKKEKKEEPAVEAVEDKKEETKEDKKADKEQPSNNKENKKNN